MKVLQVIPSVSMSHGGPSHALRLIERALREEGVLVETATTDDDGAGGRVDSMPGLLIREEDTNRRYFRKTANPYKPSIGFASWMWKNASRYELIHIHALFSFTSTVAAIAARRAGVPYVIRPLGTLASYGMTRRRPWLKRLSILLLERRILRNAAAVHFTSESELSEAASLGLSFRGVVLPLAVELTGDATVGRRMLLARFPALEGKRWILFLSRLDPKKNVETLLQSVRIGRQRLPGHAWLIAGDGDADYVKKLHSLAIELGVADCVTWAGSLRGDEKRAALAGSELFVLPSFSENFGIAAAEALSAGLPCVLGAGVAIASSVEAAGAGISVDPDPISVSDAVVRVCGDENLRTLMSGIASGFAHQHFSVALLGRRLRRLYDDILVSG